MCCCPPRVFLPRQAFAGAMVLTRKTTVALAIMIVGFILEQYGFIKNSVMQPDSALHAIVYLMIFGSGSLLLVSFLLTFKFKLTRETHKLLIKETARLKLGGKIEDCPDETKHIIKDLTGYEYHKVWGEAK